jgi:glycosyltransferase involved in cell wall biosynthesis
VRTVIVSHTYADPANRGKLRALAGQGCTLAVAVPDRWTPPGRLEPLTTTYGDDAGVRITPIAVRGTDRRGAPARWKASALKRLISDFRPDIVQVEEEPGTAVAASVAAMARKLGARCSLLTWESVPQEHSFADRLRRKRTFARLDGIVGGSALAAGLAARERPGLPSAAIPQLGIRVPLAPPVESHVPLAIGFVGRLVPEKGLDILLRASVRLFGAWSITVVGTGPAQEELESLAEKLGVAARVHWLGALPRRELANVWPRLDCLVAPSRTAARWVEAYPVPVLEAMGHGVVVVTSDSGALPDVVGAAGLVVPEDNPDALTEALVRLGSDEEFRAKLGAEGRRRVIEEYVDDALARKTLDFWRRLAGRPEA